VYNLSYSSPRSPEVVCPDLPSLISTKTYRIVYSVGITNLKTGYRFVQNQNAAESQTYVVTNAQTPCCVPNQALFCYAKRSKWPCDAETSSTPKGEDVYKTHAAKDETYEQTFFCEWNDAGYMEKSKRFGDNNEKRMMEIRNNQTETTLAKMAGASKKKI
jgi:hypothetical protein